MEVVQWKKAFLSVTDVYGVTNESLHLPKSDIIIYSQLPGRILKNKKHTVHRQFKTLHIDLTKDESVLFSELNRSTRYQINKAGRDNLNFEMNTEPSDHDIEEFAAFFNPFAKAKKIKACNMDKIRSLKKNHSLYISYIKNQNNQKLCSHAYSVDGRRANMLYSCSVRLLTEDIDKNVVGRANRYLHWQDILFLKQKGYAIYDFLGLSLDERNQELNNIERFKRGFGGKEVLEYKCYEAKSLLGKLALRYIAWSWKNNPELIADNR